MIFEIEVVLNSKQCLLFCYSLILIRLHGAWSAKVEGFELEPSKRNGRSPSPIIAPGGAYLI